MLCWSAGRSVHLSVRSKSASYRFFAVLRLDYHFLSSFRKKIIEFQILWSLLNCFSSSARVISLIKLLSSVSVASFDLSIFSSPLSRSVFFPDLLTSAKTLLKCSAFLKSVVSVSFSKCRGFGFSFRFSPDRLFSKDQASLPPCFRLSCAHVFDQVSCLDFLVISFASADFLLYSVLFVGSLLSSYLILARCLA